MSEISIHPQGHHVIISRDDSGERIALTWPEANKLQADLRQLCVETGLTVIGAFK